jgi:hypothetical protein
MYKHDGRVSSTRLLQKDGRPDRFGAGSKGSSTSLRLDQSNRLVTASVSTKSPVSGFPGR